jgi:hypothetical protein
MLDTLVSHLPASLQDKAKAVIAFVAAAATVAAALTDVLPETTTGTPQSGQKPRRVMPPCSLGDAWKRGEPCYSSEGRLREP